MGWFLILRGNMNYYINDFTEDNYVEILERLINLGYEFIGFDYERISSDSNIVIWRHDVDFSLNRAYRLAKIEKKLGVKATYFIHIQSSFYNILEPVQYRLIEKILNNGHTVGLHFDYGFYTLTKRLKDKDKIEESAMIEKNLLERYFNIQVNAISFHNPVIDNALKLQQDYYAGMVNTYSKTIFDNCKYCSDSNGYWRFDRLQEVIEKGYKKLHVLTHPAWWVPYEMLPYERIERCANGRRDATLKSYSGLLEQCGRENVKYKL